jgi:hypothetical protein
MLNKGRVMKSIHSKAQAELELALMQADADAMTSGDLYIWLRECGLSPEIAIRLKELVQVTRSIGNKVFSIGKMIVMKLRDFIAQHKGLAIGVLLAAAISSLVAAIPLLGTLLAPLAFPLGVVFAVSGHQNDKLAAGGSAATGLLELPTSLIEIARAFFDLFIDTVQIIIAESITVKTS